MSIFKLFNLLFVTMAITPIIIIIDRLRSRVSFFSLCINNMQFWDKVFIENSSNHKNKLSKFVIFLFEDLDAHLLCSKYHEKNKIDANSIIVRIFVEELYSFLRIFVQLWTHIDSAQKINYSFYYYVCM